MQEDCGFRKVMPPKGTGLPQSVLPGYTDNICITVTFFVESRFG